MRRRIHRAAPMNVPRDGEGVNEERVVDPAVDDESPDAEQLRLAGEIADGRGIDWNVEEGRHAPEETTGLQELERLAAAHAHIQRQFDEITAPGGGSLISHYRIEKRLGPDAHRSRSRRCHAGDPDP